MKKNGIKNRMFLLATIIFSIATILISTLNLFKNITFFDKEIVQSVILITVICLIILGVILLFKGFKNKEHHE